MDLFTRSLDAGPDEVLIELEASTPRRLVGATALPLLCATFLRQGFVNFSAGGVGLVPIVVALAGLYGTLRFWRPTGLGLVLTPSELRESGGRRLASVAAIVAVNREMFGIIKPTNGFVIETQCGSPPAFSPDIWWRLGKRIGVGGVTGAGAAKAMAELLQEMLTRRRLQQV